MGLFDPKRIKLSPDIFLPSSKLKPSVRLFILEKLFELIPPQLIYRVQIVGSILGFYYSEKTDVDVQVQISSSENQQDKVNYYSNEVKVFNRSDENTINGHPVSFFVLPKIEFMDYTNLASGLYCVINDKWVRLPPDRPKGFEQQIAQSRPYLNLLTREMGRQIEQVRERPILEEAKDVYDLYERLDKARKLSYDFGLGIPKYTIGNIQYKAVEKQYGNLPEQIHHLVRRILRSRKINE